ncbi:hypothetical protein SAMN05216203_2243 [Marinobacter daqiaonensis]|uniref:Secreted protein n=1 Tax=Marinobacter daqiaonensis TaxID=650891 RepID=A0A1I6IFT0_9GAMM|nr:hypothetical protein [Marinobacter daqiaonensis]SFR65647.1 hypothetical protein SAMN05216203_2243 [Marinobacter daqiaonensis]
MKRLLITLFIGLSANSVLASPLETFTQCDMCDYQEMLQAAHQVSGEVRPKRESPFAPQGPGTGYVTVLDLHSGSAATFEIYFREAMATSPPPQYQRFFYYTVDSIHPWNTDEKVTQAAGRVASAVRVLQSATAVPEAIADSAWDLVGAGYKQNQVIDHYVNNMSVFQHLNNALGSLAILLGGVVNVENVLIKMKFSDGSEADFSLDGWDSASRPRLTFLGGRDADGNIIRDSNQIFSSGSYSFRIGGHVAFNAFIDAASRFGVSVQSVPAGTVTLGEIQICSPAEQAEDANEDGYDYCF